MFGGLNLVQSSALTAASQPSYPQPNHVFQVNVPEYPDDVPLKFRQGMGIGGGPLGALGLVMGRGAPTALPIFLPGSPVLGDTVITPVNYINQFPPRNCIEAVARWFCPARNRLTASTVSVEASGMGCFCCPGYRFCKCCDPSFPTNAVPITVANPMNIDDVQQQVEIGETRPLLAPTIATMASQSLLNTTTAILPPAMMNTTIVPTGPVIPAPMMPPPMGPPGMAMSVVAPGVAGLAAGMRRTIIAGSPPILPGTIMPNGMRMSQTGMMPAFGFGMNQGSSANPMMTPHPLA